VPTRDAPIVVNKPTPWTNYVIIALLALIAGGGVVWLLVSRNSANINSNDGAANRITESTELANSARTTNTNNRNPNSTSNTQPAANTSVDQPAKPGNGVTWFVIVGSYAKNARAAAEQRLLEVKAAGYDATIIDTDDYPNLSPNYWAVVSGPYSQANALAVKSDMYDDFPEVYTKSGW
jgi:hypothetical protein